LTTIDPYLARAEGSGILDLHDHGLTALPREIGQLTNLSTLNLSGNQLTGLPPEIGQLTRLYMIDLKDNKLMALPPEINELRQLKELYLRNNRLRAGQLGIGQLVNLLILSLGGNELIILPSEICHCIALQELRVGGARLTDLPPEIGQLTSLRVLDISSNELTELPPEIGQLTSLRVLDISSNELTELPPQIGQLANLQELSIPNNRVTELPPQIDQLTNLRELDLRANELTALPSQLADLLLKGLRLSTQNNPLSEPLPEFIGRGLQALVTYLRSLKDAIAHYEAKVLLVGEGNVGKTSLIAALRNEPFIDNRDTTHGIEIRQIIVRHPRVETNITVRIWDFGGQEVYRITHQFFFSRRSLYLVVWNAREGQEQNEVEGWIRRIRLRVSEDASVLIIATHCDERPELDYPALEEKYSGILNGHFEVDNRTGRGIRKLHEAIAETIARLPHMGQLISPRWIAARDEILALAKTKPQIPYRQFSDICQRHHVGGDEIATLAKLMHDLGQIVYYGDDEGLRNFVVLDPEWLTKAISYVLEDEDTRRADGILEHAHLAEIWQNRPNRLRSPEGEDRHLF
jgi:internalin A